jgi:multiple sugar transport system ATP-binding protein
MPHLMQLGLRPEALRLVEGPSKLRGRVVHFENLGSEIFAQVVLYDGDIRLTLRATPADRQRLSLGKEVSLEFELRSGLIFDTAGKRLRMAEVKTRAAKEVA